MSIEAFRQKWIEHRYGKADAPLLSPKEQNQLAKDYAKQMVESERTTWRIVFVVLLMFTFIIYYYAG